MSDFPLSEAEAVLLTDSTQRSLIAERRMLKAKSGAFKYLCAGAAFAIAGASIGGGLWAHSRVLNKTAHVDEIAAAIVKALGVAKLNLEPTGAIEVGGSIALADKQTVSLKGGQTVELAQTAPLKVSGSIQVDIGAPDPVRPGKPTRMVENFTVFKSAPFADGAVVTGWNFQNSDQTSPSSQFCYFAKSGLSAETNEDVSLGHDGVPLPATENPSLDETGAFQKCVWFHG